jgi:hypothetical protein
LTGTREAARVMKCSRLFSGASSNAAVAAALAMSSVAARERPS